MLIELRIRDYAVIDDLTLELGPALTVLTGETGAGKSIIVGALSLLLGERASSDVVRAGAERAVVEGVFDISGMGALSRRLEELGFDLSDGLLILRRQVAAEGRNRAWVNGSPATAGVVGELGRSLVDLHGQHEHQTLVRSSEQRGILDAFGGAQQVAERVRKLHGAFSALESRIAERERRRRELEAQADFLRFQFQEIESARLESGEDVALEGESRRLEHSEELIREAERAHGDLYSGEGSVSDRLSELRGILERLSAIDPSLDQAAAALEEAYHAVTEVGRSLGGYASAVEHDPGRLEEIRRRQDLLFRLKRKYGPELADVLETGRRLREELAEAEDSGFELERLRAELESVGAALQEEAGELSRARGDAASRLSAAAEEIFPDLGMPGAVFRVALDPSPEIGPGGAESVRFQASLNPGFEPRPLSRIASGGELSRVMLALKSILVSVDPVPTLVFDEIDSGIGGVVASVVGEKLKEVSGHHQVFVVTHLPQLASRADQHLFVEKAERHGMPVAEASRLEGEQRIRELARMLGGDPESSTSRAHAMELLGVR
jgi:DNA repair protein RecN (Recombination protein N)